jgi:hypothetical protein
VAVATLWLCFGRAYILPLILEDSPQGIYYFSNFIYDFPLFLAATFLKVD